MKQAVRLYGRCMGSYLVALFLSLIVLAGVGGSARWLQIALNVLVVTGMCYMMAMDGGFRGERACTMSATVERVRGEGKTPDPEMLKDCFSKKAAVIAYALIASTFLLFSIVNIIAAPFYPPVVVSELDELSIEEVAAMYESMTEEEIALAQAEAEKAQAETNYFSVVTRALFMPFFSIYQSFGQNPDGLNMLFALLSLLIPIPQVAGYLAGPGLRVKKLKAIETGKKRKLKKLKVNQKKREPKPPKMEV